MDKHQIGVNAGKVWKLLNDNKRWSYCDLKRASELSDRDLNAAIGWLARENKIDFECSNGDIIICFLFLINFSNHFGRITYSNGIVGNVFSYDTSGSDNTAMTYFYSGTKNSSSSYPAIFSDSYGICILFGFASGYVIYRMMWSIDLYIGPYQCMCSYGDISTI